MVIDLLEPEVKEKRPPVIEWQYRLSKDGLQWGDWARAVKCDWCMEIGAQPMIQVRRLVDRFETERSPPLTGDIKWVGSDGFTVEFRCASL